MYNTVFSEIFTQEELQHIIAKGQNHPLYYLIANPDCFCASDNYFYDCRKNTEFAFSIVKNNNNLWLQDHAKHQLVSSPTNASGALGEIRCYGYLIDIFGKESVVFNKESKQKTPDFRIINNNETIIIEVATVTASENKRNHTEETVTAWSNGRIKITEIESFPFGSPTENMTTTEKVISKIATIKRNIRHLHKDEGQFSDTIPTILWIDLQDFEISSISDRFLQASPVIKWDNSYYSNEIWYALYGTKGLPIFNGITEEVGLPAHNPEFQFDGRFISGTKCDAIVVSTHSATVIFQNPNSKKPLYSWFYKEFTNVRNFKPEGSIYGSTEEINSCLKEHLRIISQIDRIARYARW